MNKEYASHIKTLNSIIVMFKGGDPPITISASNKVYDEVCQALNNGKFSNIPAMVDRALLVAKQTDGKFQVKNGKIRVDGEPLPELLSKRLLQFLDQQADATALVNFWYNLRQNPSDSSKRDLFDFLEHNHVPITWDGCFVAYKKVRSDYKDGYTGLLDNSPGKLVKMPRSNVNPNRNQTCSYGLHVAAWQYAQSYSGSNLMEVKVNPKNVVAVPIDYNQQKMRVCEYEVVKDCDGYMDEKVLLYDKDENEVEELEELDLLDEENLGEDDFMDFLDEDEQEDLALASGPPLEKPLRRIPTHLSRLKATTDGRLRVSVDLLDKIEAETGDKVFVVVPTKRSRKVVLTTEQPNDAFKVKSVMVGTASARIPASVFRAAKIAGNSWYKASWRYDEVLGPTIILRKS